MNVQGEHFGPRFQPCPWVRMVRDLALWAVNLIVRKDVYGDYIPPDRRKDPRQTAYMKQAEPTISVLEAHFSGNRVIGLYTTNNEDLCRTLIVDIDRHGDEGSPEVNEQAAIVLYERAKALGFSPILEDSNGRGGYKLWVVFKEMVPAAVLRRFGETLIGDRKGLGLVQKPEIFPKQDALIKGRYGNFVRLPGRHHTLDHWSRIWGGSTWLEGEIAAKQILATVGSSPSVIPLEAQEKTSQTLIPADPRNGRGDQTPKSGSISTDAENGRRSRALTSALRSGPLRDPVLAARLSGELRPLHRGRHEPEGPGRCRPRTLGDHLPQMSKIQRGVLPGEVADLFTRRGSDLQDNSSLREEERVETP